MAISDSSSKFMEETAAKKRVEMLRKHEQKTCKTMSGRRQGLRNVQTKILMNMNYVRKRGAGSSMANEWSNGKAGEVDPIEISDDEIDEESLLDQRENLKKSYSGLETAQNFSSNYPFFKVTMAHSYLHNAYVNIPKRFMRANRLKRRGKNIKLEVSNKTWLVKMYNHQAYGRLCAGWSDFVKDNSLQEEDVCLFELIDNDDISFRVTIFQNFS